MNSTPYKTLEQIGSGGGGIIYKAWHERLEKYVVLKEIKSSAAKMTASRAEADILKNLKHSYLPQVYDFYEQDGEIFTVMEYIEGESFDKLLENGRKYPQKDVIKWATQLAEAVAYLHSRKPPVLHSDIKPANVMLTKEGDICLIDFNISLLLGDDGAAVIGLSYGYASPEQYASRESAYLSQTASSHKSAPKIAAETATELLTENTFEKTEILPETGAFRETEILISETDFTEKLPQTTPRSEEKRSYKSVDVRSDIYSLGATLYHMITGERPAMKAAEVKPLETLGNFGESIVFIIEKAMKPEADNRFQTAAQMLKALKNINKLDSRWKRHILQKNIAAALLSILFCLSAASAVYGYRLMGEEKEERYGLLVAEINAADIGQVLPIFDEAVALFPARIDAYHAKAVQLAGQGDFEECREFILRSLPIIVVDIDEKDNQKLADLYFIVGNSYFEEEDYLNAIQYYQAATELARNNPEYYRDYAISLARTGDLQNADSLMQTAEKLNMKTDSLNLLQGEIAFAKGEYGKSADYMQDVINAASDDYIRYRAYRLCGDAFKRQGRFSEQAALLEAAIPGLPLNRTNEMTERLAEAYVALAKTAGQNESREYYLKAADLFNQLKNNGYATFHVRQNLGIIYQQLNMYNEAEIEFDSLAEDYPNDYRPHMRNAFLQADKQQSYLNESRNYTYFNVHYETALELYNKTQTPDEEDPEMLMLASMVEELRDGGWI